MRTTVPRTPATALALVLASSLFALVPGQAGADVRASESRCATGSRAAVTSAGLDRAARADRTVKVDACRRVYVAEAAPFVGPVIAGRRDTQAVAKELPAPLSRTFTLQSLPGSTHTIYLDFTGATVTGTAFNDDYGVPTLEATPFSMTAPADTNFADSELAAIQQAWQVVAEDFAPFDVNVTTAEPEADALSRSSTHDTTWGVTVVATTAGGPLQTACRCGGLAYVGGVAETGDQRDYHQPGFVFGAVTREGVGEAISHEVGHMFGLFHDGTTTDTYYDGSEPWAPIMGTGYKQPLTQWSAGEYDGASNVQDDVALISQYAPFRRDDHGDDELSGTPVALGGRASGVIATRTDVDAFTFLAGGRVTVRVTVPRAKGNLDAQMRIVDAAGRTIAFVDDMTERLSPSSAVGLGVAWRGRLPRPTATYTLLVDGAGEGHPSEHGSYTDYGSMGAYSVVLRRR